MFILISKFAFRFNLKKFLSNFIEDRRGFLELS